MAPTTPRSGVPTYHESRAIREAYRARLIKFEYERAVRKLLRLDEINDTWTKFILCCRERLLAMPSRLAPQLAEESDLAKINELLRGAIYEALEELSRYGQQGTDEEE